MQSESYPSNTAPRLFKPESTEVAEITSEINNLSAQTHELAMVIGGKKIMGGGKRIAMPIPHHKSQNYAFMTLPSKIEIEQAVENSLSVSREWSETSIEHRAAIFSKVADLIEFKYRDRLVAATMIGQSKTVFQADADAASGTIDALRFNSKFALDLYKMQPPDNKKSNIELDYRPLEGFVYAITPFNFTLTSAILSTVPALMGNVVIWKPSMTAMLPAQILMDIFQEAGLPDGVINLVPGYGPEVSEVLLNSKHLAGIYFTGSTNVFRQLWKEVANNLDNYRSFPRLVGETGGKGFVIAHSTANPDTLISALIRSAFEYQGQKCSACSRVYISQSLWDKISEKLIKAVGSLAIGAVTDFKNFMSAVIDQNSFDRLADALEAIKQDSEIEILTGANANGDSGYFVEPTLLLCENPNNKIFHKEYFGPILAIHVFPDDEYEAILELVDSTSDYALTGSVFAEDEKIIEVSLQRLRNCAGSLNVNDKPTGVIMGKHPFGGSRASGTNDKSGWQQSLLRWTSPRVIKRAANTTVEILHPHQL